MQRTLPQMDALHLWSELDPAAAQTMLALPASWYVDASGVAHGKSHTPASTAHTGTFEQVLSLPRCSTKGCATASRIAGSEGTHWATYAQRYTSVHAEIAQLQDACATTPWTVVARTTELLSDLSQGPADMALPVATVMRDLHDLNQRAIDAWHDPERLERSLRTCARGVLYAEAGPLNTLCRLTKTITFMPTPLLTVLRGCDGSPQWVDAFLTEYAAVPELQEVVAGNLNRIRELDGSALRTSITNGTPIADALLEAHAANVEVVARSIPRWWAARETELLGDTRVALVAAPGTLNGTLAEFEMYREAPSSPLLLTPAVVGEWFRYHHRGSVTLLEQPPSHSELEIMGALVGDALASDVQVNLDDLLASARALAK